MEVTNAPTEKPDVDATNVPTEMPTAGEKETPTEVPEEETTPNDEDVSEENKDTQYGTLGLGLVYVAAGTVLVAVLILIKKIKKSEL